MMRFLRKLSMLLRRRQLDRELDEEIRFHLEMQAADGSPAGSFGNATLVREAARQNWGWPAAEDVLREVRYAIRSIWRSPLASLAAVASLGLGIGIATAVLSIVDAIFLRTLNVPDPDQLVSLYQRGDNGRGGYSSHAYPHYEHLRDHSRSYQGLAAFARIPVNGRIDDAVERMSSELVSSNYFDVLGAAPVLGRGFLPGETNVVVLSHRLWRDRYGSDPQVPGRKLALNGHPFTIIGVLPESFESVVLDWGKAPSLWLPFAASHVLPELPLSNPRSHWILVVGRLRPEVRIAQAQAEAEALSRTFYERYPFAPGMAFQPAVLPTQQARFWPGLRESVVNYVSLLAAVAALTFFMACFNVANLLLGRATRRRRELGIQVAIGAGRLRLARALLLEAGLIAFSGALVGLGVASLAPTLLDQFHNPFGVPLTLDLTLNGRVMGFVLAVALLTTLLIGLSPVRMAWRIDVTNLIKSDALVAGNKRLRLVDLLVVAQVAICLTSLAGASLLLRTLREAQASDPLFRSGNALLAGVDLLSAGYEEARGQAFLRELLTRVRQAPGVESAAYVKTVPLGGFRGARDVRVNGIDANVQVNTVSAGYFGAARVPIVRGRDMRDGETVSVVINEPMSRRFWPGEDPIGKQLHVAKAPLPFTVAGVVRDGRMRNFREASIVPCVYLPLEADYQRTITLYVRTAGHPLSMVSTVRTAMQELDPDLPFEASTLEMHLNTALSRERLAAAMLSVLGVFATLLAALGLYGLISVAVSQRSREIGIRMALGSHRAGVVGTVMRRFLALLGVGAMLGVLASAVLARFVETLLFGVKALDPLALGGSFAVLALVAMLASMVPAMRAALTDPMTVLRQD